MQGQNIDPDEELIRQLRQAWLRHERAALWAVYVLGLLVLVLHGCCLIWGV